MSIIEAALTQTYTTRAVPSAAAMGVTAMMCKLARVSTTWLTIALRWHRKMVQVVEKEEKAVKKTEPERLTVFWHRMFRQGRFTLYMPWRTRDVLEKIEAKVEERRSLMETE